MNYKVILLLPKDAEGNPADPRSWVTKIYPDLVNDFDVSFYQSVTALEEVLVGYGDFIYENDVAVGVTYTVDLPPGSDQLPDEPLYKRLMLEFLNSDDFSTKGSFSLQPL